VLGRGVFGEVWLAKKKTSGIDKAIKIVTQPPERDATKRELRSLELIKNLRHPYLLCTEDFWVGDGRLHIVMELAECTLRNRLERCREENLPGIPETELIGYIREAAEGLDFLHSRHVVHRDVKPDNILILNGHAKVADFGLAWQQDKLLAPMKTFAGTPAYMAPEVWGKEGGPASDLYSLAVTYAELRQGHPPLKSQQIEEMMLAHLGGSHDFEPPIRDEERPVLAKALARAPEDRYSSCMDFVEALSGALGMSFQPRSSAFSESKARLHSQGSDARKLDSRPQLATSVASHGTLLPGSDLQSPLETRAGRSTLGDAAKPPLPSPAEIAVRTPRARFKALLAAVLTLALIATAAAIAAFFWNSGKVQHPSISGAEETVATPPTKAVTPPAQSIPTIPTRQTLPPPPPDRTILPPRAQRDPNSQIEVLADDRRVYDWISIPVGSEIVRFRLIGGGQAPKPTPPFYVMESKVWNQLLRSAGKAPPIGSEANGPFAPVTNLTFEQAAAFAREAFDGRLPSALEWDLAAGLYAGLAREEVTRAGGSPRVALAKPEPTAGANAGTDIDHFGLRDMAGNGREWTRTLFGPAGEREIDSAPLAATDRIVLRGRSFTLSRGLTFEMLRYEQAVPQTQFANAPSPYTSFRVAIPVPTK
jgi:serine/threonine protein kinase